MKIYKFANYEIMESTVFYKSKYSFGFVNLRPITKGHILLCPYRVVKKYNELTEQECIDLWYSARVLGDNLKAFYKTDSIDYTIQDGKDAGQTVEHVHIHIIPFAYELNLKSVDNESIYVFNLSTC
jgi:bis(5'-adenosyl)-triphosphatase